MIVADISRNLYDIEPKLAFGFTKRQLICFMAAALIGFPVYRFLRSFLPGELATFGMIIATFPCMLFGFYKKNRQHMEDILFHIWQAKVVRPKKRPYRTENQYLEIEEAIRWNRERMKNNAIRTKRSKRKTGQDGDVEEWADGEGAEETI